jgi:hypothetical protein
MNFYNKNELDLESLAQSHHFIEGNTLHNKL